MKERQIKQGDMHIFSPEKVIHVPGFFSAVHLRTAIGIPMCPIIRNWLTTLTSLRIFTSFTHLHTHLQNRHWTLIRGGKKWPTFISPCLHTHESLCCGVILFSSNLTISVFTLSSSRLSFLSLTHGENHIHTDTYAQKYCTHTKTTPPSHTHILTCWLAGWL